MRGYALHRTLASRSTFLGEGGVRGLLLDLGRYPGLVVGAGHVRGEIYRLDDPNFSRCSTERRGTISSVAARSSRSRTAGARARGSTATAGHRIGRSPSRTGITGGCTRALLQENVNGDDRR